MRKNSALNAWLKFAEMKKKVTAPWSKETPHDVIDSKKALEEPPPQNTMQRPKDHPLFDGGSTVDSGSNVTTAISYKDTPAYPWDNEYLDP